ncbi:hypothetical protein Plano_1304 [Planococcus sp. PAMC 21323]|uniref:hypothetical protein n=1 Tax=Planococcus sp. PAMC 21323 TaxID=1526927 RepID=UPI0005862E1A|nr:hypothetical protein [Planococcus sp. PAMC 21323]AIY05269.1 hypothetical protein Plano_1304 [Planococcus sp. PAMC 21323]
MDITQLDIKEIKYLKKKKLIQDNIFMLLIFLFLIYFASNERHSFIIGSFFVYIWIAVAFVMYTLKTGKHIGTKTSIYVKRYDRNKIGEKRWKRNKLIELFIIGIIGIGIGFVFIFENINTVGANIPSYYFPFIGSWIGFNLGEIGRMSKLQEQ